MQNFVRIISLALAIGLAGLWAGCVGHRSSQSALRAGNSSDFEVVETSTKRLLTPQEMLQLKIAIAKYLDKEGAVASGDYYVKVYLGADEDGVPADWVVVRFTRDRNTRFSLLASYPTSSPGYQSYSAYDYYPYGYDHFSRISFQYYHDPFYGSRYYFPPGRRHPDRRRDHDRDTNHDGDNAGTNERPRFKPIDPVGSPPPVNRPHADHSQGDNHRGGDTLSGPSQRPGRDNRPPRDANSSLPPERTQAAPRYPSGGPSTRSDLHRRDHNPAPSSSNQPIRTSSQSAPRTEPVSPDSARSEPSIRTSSQSAPSYSAPARAEANPSLSQRESKQSTAQRERLE